MSGAGIIRSLEERVQVYAGMLLLSAMNVVIYVLQIAESNAYAGMQPLELTPSYLFRAIGGIFFVGVCIPTVCVRPSHFFSLIYGLFVPLTFAVLHPVGGGLSLDEYVAFLALLMLPLLVHQGIVAGAPRIAIPHLLNSRMMEFVIVAICLAGAFVAFVHRPEAASLDVDFKDERRLQARDIFTAGSLLAYLISIVGNGLLPFLAFISGLRGRVLFGAVSTLLAVVLYFVLAVKAPFAYIGMAYFVGKGVAKEKPHFFHYFMVLALVSIFIIFVVERQFHEYTIAGEYIYRRAFDVPAQIMSYYLDFMFGERYMVWSPTSGTKYPDGLTFLIGNLYFGLDTANVNTNAYLFALASGGVAAFIGTMVLTSAVFAFLDGSYEGTGNRGFYFIGFAYAILLVEQAATTALLSSGIGLLIILMCLSSRGWTAYEFSKGARR